MQNNQTDPRILALFSVGAIVMGLLTFWLMSTFTGGSNDDSLTPETAQTLQPEAQNPNDQNQNQFELGDDSATFFTHEKYGYVAEIGSGWRVDSAAGSAEDEFDRFVVAHGEIDGATIGVFTFDNSEADRENLETAFGIENSDQSRVLNVGHTHGVSTRVDVGEDEVWHTLTEYRDVYYDISIVMPAASSQAGSLFNQYVLFMEAMRFPDAPEPDYEARQ